MTTLTRATLASMDNALSEDDVTASKHVRDILM